MIEVAPVSSRKKYPQYLLLDNQTVLQDFKPWFLYWTGGGNSGLTFEGGLIRARPGNNHQVTCCHVTYMTPPGLQLFSSILLPNAGGVEIRVSGGIWETHVQIITLPCNPTG